MANLLGIDIGPTSVRGVLVKTQLRRVQLAQYIEVPIPAELPVEPAAYPNPFAGQLTPDGVPLDPVASAAAAAGAPAEPIAEPVVQSPLARAVAELLRIAGGNSIDILAALPGDSVSLRRVELPKAAEKKLEELLPFEMESLLPFELEDTLLDHQLIDGDATQIRLLVSAAPKERIRSELLRLKEIGADPVELVPAPAALAGLAQFVPTLATEGPHMLVVLGAASTDVCVIRKGRAELARTLSVAGDELLRRPAPAAFGVAFGHEPPPVTLDEQVAARFARELKQTMLAYRMQGGIALESIVVAGHSAFPGLFDWLSEHLGQQVIPLALPDVVAPPGVPPADMLQAPDPTARARFTLALAVVGHSLLRGKHLDFRKGEFVKKRDLSVLRDFGPVASIALGAIACAFFFSIWARWSVLEDRRAMLEDELARVTEERLGEETRSLERARSLLETGRRSADPMPAFTAFDALRAVSDAVPEGVTHDLSRLAVELGDGRSEGRIEIQGTVGSVDDAERIARALGEVPCFQELEMGPATNTADGRRSYRIEGDIRCPGTEVRTTRRRGGSSRSGGGASTDDITGGEG
jgi:Tfp pilus assembly PilM family ATPase